MSMRSAPPESDLHLPLPGVGEDWHSQTIHTHYFGFQIPEEQLGAWIYLKYFPAFPLLHGGVQIFRGMGNEIHLDAEHLNYETTMRWPKIDGSRIHSENGLTIDFVEPGKRVELTYRSLDGRASFEIEQTAITPLFWRGHIMPGEELHHGELRGAGGSEQFMHCTGSVTLDDSTYAIDCYPARDRSWEQVRMERKVPNMAPIGWSPICFGPDLAFNAVGQESAKTNPTFLDAFDLANNDGGVHFTFIVENGETREMETVHRNVIEHDEATSAPIRQEIEAIEPDGRVHRFSGEAIALCPTPSWPNAQAFDSIVRWTDEQGRVGHSSYQELWFDDFRHVMRGSRRARRTVRRPT